MPRKSPQGAYPEVLLQWGRFLLTRERACPACGSDVVKRIGDPPDLFTTAFYVCKGCERSFAGRRLPFFRIAWR